MKKYQVTVNGTLYKVELTELTDAACGKASPTPMPAASASVSPAPAASISTSPVSAACGEPISAPMPGTILSVSAAAGDSVQKGQVIMILEAMKMENEILCPRDGVIASVAACRGPGRGNGRAPVYPPIREAQHGSHTGFFL